MNTHSLMGGEKKRLEKDTLLLNNFLPCFRGLAKIQYELNLKFGLDSRLIPSIIRQILKDIKREELLRGSSLFIVYQVKCQIFTHQSHGFPPSAYSRRHCQVCAPGEVQLIRKGVTTVVFPPLAETEGLWSLSLSPRNRDQWLTWHHLCFFFFFLIWDKNNNNNKWRCFFPIIYRITNTKRTRISLKIF